jgi:hypothetical protein
MELVLIFRRLWAHKRTLIFGVVLSLLAGLLTVYRPGLSPLSLEQRGVVYGSASTEVLVDSTDQPLTDVKGDLSSLAERAALYSDFARSDEMRAAIARRTGVPASQLLISSGSRTSTQNQTRTGEQRASFLTYEGTGYRVLVAARFNLPLLDVFTTARDARAAVRLADATAAALADYVRRQQPTVKYTPPTAKQRQARREQGLPPLTEPKLVRIRQLGAATGGLVNQGADRQAAILAALVAFILYVVLVTVASNVATGIRRYPSSAPQVPDAA